MHTKIQIQKLFLQFQTAKTALQAALPGVSEDVLETLAEVFEAPKPKPQTKATGPGKQKCGICGKPGHNSLGHKTATRKDRQVSKEAQARATKGRRDVLSGKRPPIKDVITRVIGTRIMNVKEVYEAIKKLNQLPNSKDPKGYVGYLLSATKLIDPATGDPVVDSTGKEITLWERSVGMGRGYYRNRPEFRNKSGTQRKLVAKPKPAVSPHGSTGLKKILVTTLGSKSLSVQQIYDALKAQGFVFGSKNPKKSIDDCVSKHKADFTRTSRGVWRRTSTDELLKASGIAVNGV